MALAQDGLLYPIRFTATTYNIRVEVNSVLETIPFPATGSLTAGRNYYVSGDGQADSSTNNGTGDLLLLLKTALDAHSEAVAQSATFTVSATAANLVTISISATDFRISWGDVLTTLDYEIFGFIAADAPSPADTDTTAPDNAKGIWRPAVVRGFDSRDRQPFTGSVAQTMSGKTRTSALVTNAHKERELVWRLVTREKALDEYVGADDPNGAFETAWRTAIALGYRFRFYEDISSRTSSSYTLYRARDLSDPLGRNETYPYRWDVSLACVRGDY